MLNPEIALHKAICFSWEMYKRHFTFFLLISVIFYFNGVTLSTDVDSFELNLLLTIFQVLVILVALKASLVFYRGKPLQLTSLFPGIITIYRTLLASLCIGMLVMAILLVAGFAGSEALRVAANIPQVAGLPYNTHWLLLFVVCLVGIVFLLARLIFVYYLIVDQNRQVFEAFQMTLQLSRNTGWQLALSLLGCLIYISVVSLLFLMVSYPVVRGIPHSSHGIGVYPLVSVIEICKILTIYPLLLGFFTSLYHQLPIINQSSEGKCSREIVSSDHHP